MRIQADMSSGRATAIAQFEILFVRCRVVQITTEALVTNISHYIGVLSDYDI